jgi:S-adenosylmethionine:tRNA ribosyltransferase-isomerase
MHSEWYRIPAETAAMINETRRNRGRIVAVGTTSSRTLEGAFKRYGEIRAIEDETNIFITPGFTFNVVDALITNFHLPKSTLMMLVTAFGGYERLMNAYQHAIDTKYRFFSFGDAMFITKQTT